ncbi:MAG: LD-carboxypeptidase [Clostridiales bacterium]|nr:LD-carboxypeptidase [Clostridiales bacterium]
MDEPLRRNVHGDAAGTPEERAACGHAAFADDTVQGIWCVRGGYTCAQVMPLLDYGLIAAHPKPVIGYSDITALHAALWRQCGLPSWHGPMAWPDLAEQPHRETEACLLTMLAASGRTVFHNPGGRALTVLRPGNAFGPLVGGNLTVLASLLGTPWFPETAGAVLFLEDVREPVPSLERMLFQLKSAGVFEKASAILLGRFADCENRRYPAYGADALFRDFFRAFHGPVTAGLQCGHCCPNGTLPLGRQCQVRDGEIWFIL